MSKELFSAIIDEDGYMDLSKVDESVLVDLYPTVIDTEKSLYQDLLTLDEADSKKYIFTLDHFLYNLGLLYSLAIATESNLSNSFYNKFSTRCYNEISNIFAALQTDKTIENKIRAIFKKKRSLKKHERAFIDSYVELFKDAKKQRKHKKELKAIETSLEVLYKKYDKNILNDESKYIKIKTKKELTGIPELDIKSFRQEAKKNNKKGYWVPCSNSSLRTLVTNADDRGIREKAYLILNNIGNFDNRNNNNKILNKIYKLKNKKSKLLGYKSIADIELDFCWLNSKESVDTFLTNLEETASSELFEINQQITNYAVMNGIRNVMPWDEEYILDKITKKPTEEMERIKKYFPYKNVKKGLFSFLKNNFNIELKSTDKNGLNKLSEVFEVRHNKKKIGYINLDLFANDNKSSGASCYFISCAHSEILDQCIISSDFLLNTDAIDDYLMSKLEIETLYHEIGHAINGFLCKNKYMSISGLGFSSEDSIEIQSQLLENFVNEKDFVKKWAKDTKTNKPISDEDFETYLKSSINKVFSLKKDILRSKIDISLTSLSINSKKHNSVARYEKSFLNKQYYQHPDISVLTWLSHIVSGMYTSKYYSYLFSLCLEKDIYASIEGKSKKELKRRMAKIKKHIYQNKEMLSSQDAFRRILGRSYNTSAFIKSLKE